MAELSLEKGLTDEQYLNLLSEIKHQGNDVIISPYFKHETEAKIQLSNFFHVKLKEEKDVDLLKKMADQTGSSIIFQDASMPLWFTLGINGSSKMNALECANFFHESDLFQKGEPDLMADLLHCANDQYFGDQWGLKNTGKYGGTIGTDINICNAWSISTGANITVAVIDQGFELNHPDFAGNVHSFSYDCESGISPQQIRGSHGTACAGIIGAMKNNNGIAGVAPNCKLMSISHSLTLPNNFIREQLADGIDKAMLNGADVISCSWGSTALEGTYITDAINNAVLNGRDKNGTKYGCVVVFSSGNDNATSVLYPSKQGNVISVGAISPCGERKSPTSCDGETLWGSNYGDMLDVVAPGVLVPTTDRQSALGYNPSIPIHTNNGGSKINSDYTNQDYTVWFNGTSAACPHVSGIAALILSAKPNLTQAAVRSAIESSCKKLSGYSFSNNASHPYGTWNNQVGHGLVNAFDALDAVGAVPPPAPVVYVKVINNSGNQRNGYVQIPNSRFYQSISIGPYTTSPSSGWGNPSTLTPGTYYTAEATIGSPDGNYPVYCSVSLQFGATSSNPPQIASWSSPWYGSSQNSSINLTIVAGNTYYAIVNLN